MNDRDKKPLGDYLSGWWHEAKTFAEQHNLLRPTRWPRWAYLFVAAVLLVVFSIAYRPGGDDVALPTAILVIADGDHETEGSVILSGVKGLTERDIESRLTIEPTAWFTVTKLSADEARITLEEPRNIAYRATFDRGGDEKPFQFYINGQPLTVKLQSTSVLLYDAVELIFSEQVDIYSLRENLRIEPASEFTLEVVEYNRVIIRPYDEWYVSDSYQIRIDAGYASVNGRQFAEHQTLSFKVRDFNNARHYIRSSTESNYVLAPDKDFTLVFFGNNLKEPVPVVVETYQMDSVARYREQGHILLDFDVSLDILPKVDTNVYLIENGENRFTVPNPGAGAYIVSARYTDPDKEEPRETRTGYFITPLSVYLQSSARETLAWLNSSAEAAPLGGYEIVFDKIADHRGTTDGNGLLILNHPTYDHIEDQKERRRLENLSSNPAFSVYDPAGDLVYYDDSGLQMQVHHSERFYSYLFLDRTIYRPEDTVCFWGFIAPFRNNQKSLPGTVEVRFDPGGLDILVPCEVDADGIFSGEIALERIRSSQYYISAEVLLPADDPEGEPTRHTFESTYVSVKEFEKPTYTLASRTDKNFYAPGDTVTVSTTAAFYDGTPLSFFELEVAYYSYATYSWERLPNVTTDGLGAATFSFPAHPGGDSVGSNRSSHSASYRVQIASDGEQISHVRSYRYFPSDLLVDCGLTRTGEAPNLTLGLRAYRFDMETPAFAALLETIGDNYYYFSEDELALARGEPADIDLGIALRWHYTDTNRIRHNNRQSAPYNRYMPFENSYSLDLYGDLDARDMEIIDSWETSEKRIGMSTAGGSVTVGNLIHLREGTRIDFTEPVTLRAEITYTDGRDNSCEVYAYYPDYSLFEALYWGYDGDEDDVKPGYNFVVTDLTDGGDLTPSRYGSSVTMNVGSRARFELQKDGEAVRGGRLLYSVIQDGLYSHAVASGDRFELTYPMAYGRGTQLVATYFDGRETHYVTQLSLRPDDTSMTLDIDVTPDRASYRPGEEVTLRVRATDMAGNGVPGHLCISVVDESIFALSEQYINVLYSLYSNVSYVNNSVTRYCTTYRHEPPPGIMADGGKGGGGEVEFYDSYRSNFKDTALFLPTRTDAYGNATVRFTLPDNTTSWRITAVEIGADLKAGQHKSNIISTLPFFVRPVLTSKYIEGDDLAMIIQGHGTLLHEEADISYTVRVTGDGVDETLTAEARAFQPVQLNFGKLPQGAYTVVSRAQYSGYADTVELPVSIMKSNLELVIHKAVDPMELDINALRYPVTLTLYDEGNEAFLTSINSLFGHYCMQANQRLSRFVAKRVIRSTVTEGMTIPHYIAESSDSAADMQNDDGGIAFYPGYDSDPLVTTYTLLVAGDQFNQGAMSRYFIRQLATATDPKERAACYLGLAYLGEVAPDKLLELLEDDTLRTDVRAYYIAALAYLSETETAMELYEQYLAGHIGALVSSARQSDTYDRDAAAIWIAASRLGHADADGYSLYFGRSVWRFRTLFECMIYATNYDRPVTPATITYTMNGETHTENLGLRGIRTLTLSKSELESLRFISAPDSLKAVAYYVGEPEEMGLEPSENIGIQKLVRRLDDNTHQVTLVIYLSKDAPRGDYDISDWVPSNTRLYEIDHSYHNSTNNRTTYFNVTNEGQKLYIAFNNRYAEQQLLRFTYRVRTTYDAEAVLDTTYMIHGNSGENASSEKRVFDLS